MTLLKRIQFLALLVAAAFVLTSCRLDITPIESATIKSFNNGRLEQSWQLSDRQVRELNAWLNENRGGWESTLTSYTPTYLVSATHKDGLQTTINVSRNVVVIAIKGEQQVQKFDASDMRRLTTLLTGDVSWQQ